MHIRINAFDLNKKDTRVFVAEEENYVIFHNNFEIINLLCSPENLDELAIGFLTVAGVLCPETDYYEINVDQINKKINVYSSQLENIEFDFKNTVLGTGCGMSFVFSEDDRDDIFAEYNYSIDKNTIISLMTTFNELSLNKNESRGTMGLHSAALVSKDKIVVVRQDVGRHNAVDKIFGWLRNNNIHSEKPAILITGRISAEMVWKCLKAKIPMIVSRSSATSKAVEIAAEKGITLIGYVLTKRAVIYTAPERVG